MDPYEFAITRVQEAGEMLLKARDKGFEVSAKGGSPRDIVTTTDLEVSTFLVNAIRQAFPTHSIYSEEEPEIEQKSEYRWAIDPIDGSSNFSRGIPHFSVCMGLLQKGTPIVGAVYNPVTHELFSFKKGGGAFLNGTKIHVSNVTELAKAQIIFSPGSRKQELWDWAAASYRKLLEHSLKRGMYGGSALDLSFIASGRADAAIYGTLNTLDIAAALGILYEAGGVACNERGEPLSLDSAPAKIYIANNPRMLEELRTLLEG